MDTEEVSWERRLVGLRPKYFFLQCNYCGVVKYPSDLVTEEEEVGLFWEWGSKDNETQTVTRERERDGCGFGIY